MMFNQQYRSEYKANRTDFPRITEETTRNHRSDDHAHSLFLFSIDEKYLK